MRWIAEEPPHERDSKPRRTMKHRSTIAIFSEWQRLARDEQGNFHTPLRESVNPRKLGRHLSDLFFLETDKQGDLSVRLAGTRICTLFGRELKNTRFLSLWPERDRPALREMMQNVNMLGIPALSIHDGISLSGRSLRFEMFLAPLEASDSEINLLGSIAIPDPVAWIGADPVVLGHLNAVKPVAPDLSLAHDARKSAAIIVNESRVPHWTTSSRQQARKVPKLRVINGGRA